VLEHVLGLKCLICGQEYKLDEIDYVCPKHGNEGIVDLVYDYARIGRGFSRNRLAGSQNQTMWRYLPLLPVRTDTPLPPLPVGWTPLLPARALGSQVGLPNLWLKDDGRNPTASFKDRASALAVVKGRERRADVITTASTGNAAAALAGLCASVGQKNVIFVPRAAPPAKVTQLLVYGATVLLVDGTYDDAFELCLQAAVEFGWYNRNTAYNPMMSEGKKTAAYEICEQFDFDPPDRVFVSVGDGCIIGGLYKGFKDMTALGWIDKIPRLMGVQAAGSNYLYQAWKKGEDVLAKPAIRASTVADSISAGLPRDRLKAMAAVTETGGAFIEVADEAILAAIPALARASGIFAEPAAAAAYAGLLAAISQDQVSPDEHILLLITGSGLKDVPAASQAAAQSGVKAHTINPTLKALKKALNL
jgi:threonine synthase